jgi:DNA-binding response OmpR family regulator
MNTKAKIILVEDDPALGFVVKDELEENGYDVTHCSDGEEALNLFQKKNFDIGLFDVMMPNLNGIALAQKLRKKNTQMPIIFLTAKNQQEDKLQGLKAGGDDYITKPFDMQELILKIEIFLKRSKYDFGHQTTTYTLGSYQFDFSNLKLTTATITQQLTQKEADLLKYFCEHQNIVIKRDEILTQIWGKDDYFLGRSMDVFITKLRKHLKQDPELDIQTIHGVGFKFVVPQ